MNETEKQEQALAIVKALGLPRAQQNTRSALCLLALCDMTPDKAWSQAQAPYMGITPIMDWAKEHYAANYAPNTRETFRRQTMHQFVAAGIALYDSTARRTGKAPCQTFWNGRRAWRNAMHTSGNG